MSLKKENLEELEKSLDRVLVKAEKLKDVLEEIDNLQDNSPRGLPDIPDADGTSPDPSRDEWVWNVNLEHNVDSYCDGHSGDIWQDIYE